MTAASASTVQFLESSYVGLRSAVHLLESKEASPQFLVIPMVHIGDRSFYEEVARRLGECQTIIYEGVPGFRAKLLIQAYRITARKRSLDLVLQGDALRMSAFNARKIHADVTVAGHSAHWRALPWLHQLGLLVLAPATCRRS